MTNQNLLKKAKAATTAAPVKEKAVDEAIKPDTVLKEGIAPAVGAAVSTSDSGIEGSIGAATEGSTLQATGGDTELPITGDSTTEGNTDTSTDKDSGINTYGVVLYHLTSKEGVVPAREYFTVFPPAVNDDLEVKEYTSVHQIKVNIKDKAKEQEAVSRFLSEVRSQEQLTARGFGRR